jgi:formylglycine-generating enzyme
MNVIRWTPVITATSAALLALLAACGGSTQATDTTATASTAKPAPTQPAPAACAPGTHSEGGACVADAAPAPTTAATTEPVKTAETKPETPAKPASPCPPEMAFVAGGNFKMGLLKIDATISDLCMDKVETTAKEFETCVNDKKCTDSFATCAPEATYKKPGKEDHPMVCVDFKQAVDYCTYRGKRLPSDEEWEWAARGGAEGRIYPWGNDAPKDQVCWSGAGARTSTCSVNEHPSGASKDGLLGMAGNVFEWTTNRQDSRTKDRVGRGGSWRDGLTNIMRTDRPGKFEVTYRCGFLGIRCVMPPQSPK